MWPWLMILAGTLLIIGALVARHRMLRDYRAGLEPDRKASASGAESASRAASTSRSARRTSVSGRREGRTGARAVARSSTGRREGRVTPVTRVAATADLSPTATAAQEVLTTPTPARAAPATSAATSAAPVPAFARAADTPTLTTRREVKAARAAGQPVVTGPPPLFADLPVGHRLSTAPTVRVGAQDVPLQDWLRYYAEGSAWSGVIQSISDRVAGDPLLQSYFGSMDRPTLQRHVMSTVMMLTGEGVTVGAVRRLADAHLRHVRSGGQPVTEPVWNRMAATLGNALREHNAPEAAILSLNTTVSPLRSVIVSRDHA